MKKQSYRVIPIILYIFSLILVGAPSNSEYQKNYLRVKEVEMVYADEIILPPQGLYDSCWIEEEECVDHLEVMAKHGFKLVLNYGQMYGSPEAQLKYADRAQELGIQIIWSINYLAEWTDNNLIEKYDTIAAECNCKNNIDLITYFVNLVKDHPATWGYYMADEVPVEEHDRLKTYTDLVKRLDPEHPRLFVAAASNDPMEIFFTFPSSMQDTTDVLGAAYYPYGYIDSGDNLTRFTGEAAETTEYWATKLGIEPAVVLQAFSQIRYAHTPLCFPWPSCAPFPSYDQMKEQRDQVLLNSKPSIILWWTYQDILRTDNPDQHLKDLAAAAFSPLPTNVSESRSEEISECPIDWNCEDIGNPPIQGKQSHINNIWQISGSGWDIWSSKWETADQFRFVWQEQEFNGEYIAQITSQTRTSPSAKAGIMIRKTYDPISPYFAVYVTPSRGVRVQYRSQFGQNSRNASIFPKSFPQYVKIKKSQTEFSAYISDDGENWLYIPNSTVDILELDGKIMAGMAVTSRNTGELSTAKFEKVKIITQIDTNPTQKYQFSNQHTLIIGVVTGLVLILGSGILYQYRINKKPLSN